MAVFTACTSDNDDNPASAVDDKEWKADANKDTSIRPGDDFFMYCNGGWWNNTKADDDNSFPKLFMGQIVDEMNRREAALTLPSKTKVLADAAQKDTAAVVAQKAKLQSALDRVNALTTKEEAWQLMAQLYMEGYRTPMELTSFAKKGKMVVALWPPIDKDYNALQLWSKQSMSWRLSNDPEMH